jgi:hypothetical protein
VSVLIGIKEKDRPRLVPKIVKQHKIELEVEVKFIMVMKGKEMVGECQPELYKDSPGSVWLRILSQIMTIFTCASLLSKHRPEQ